MVPSELNPGTGGDFRLDSRLSGLLDRLRPERQAIKRLVVKTNGRLLLVPLDEIDWMEAAGNYVRLHIGKDVQLLRMTMNQLETKLDAERFLRIHRSVIVNLDRVQELQPWFHGEYQVILRSGKALRLSRSHRRKLEDIFGRL